VHDLDFPLKNKKKTTSTTFEKPFGQQFTPPPPSTQMCFYKNSLHLFHLPPSPDLFNYLFVLP
jgi:hypothetical protein